MNAQRKKTSITSAKKPQVIPGLADILPSFSDHDRVWQAIMSKLPRLAHGFGFLKVQTPTLEDPNLFLQSNFGDKTILTFADPQGERVALAAHILPAVMRAYSQYKPAEGTIFSKWYYCAPVTLYDQKQKNFAGSWEYGFELFGEYSPINEVQLITAVWKFMKALGLENILLEINSVGRGDCRSEYEEALSNFLQSRKYELCNDCVAAINDFPMQVFRCKNLECRTVASEAPQVVEFLDVECHKHFTNVLEGLDELGVAYSLNPMLVGRPGTSRTTFAIKQQHADGEYFLGEGACQDDIYKNLIGKAVSCFGFEGNFELLQKAILNLNITPLPEHRAEVFLAPLGDLASKKALRLFSELWDAQISVHDHFGAAGVKNQLKLAEGSKAIVALIIGQKEAMDDTVILRDVKSGMQEVFRYDQIIEEVKKRLGR